MSYTNVAKPTDSTYTAINAQGREQFDQASLSFDDSLTFYDGVDENAYTSVSKPTGSVYTFISKPT
jgi:hypothetical protein